VTDLADRSLAELSGVLAAATPSPGGGCAAAWSCALAAALVEMAAGTAMQRGAEDAEGARRILARATELRARALRLGEDDAAAYVPVLAALRLDAGPAREHAVTEALDRAAGPPLAIADAAAEAAELGAEAGRVAPESLAGDLTASVLLAEAACRAAVRLVELNLAGVPGDARLAAGAGLAVRAGRARRAVEGR
jgi:methenyltetrahydrofolate cyclohydrolase